MIRTRSRSNELWQPVAKGIVAGLAGTAAMSVAQSRLLPLIPTGTTRKTPRYPREPGAQEEVATETAARRVVEGLAHRRLSGRRKRLAGDLVHYGTGAAWGGLLGLVSSRPPRLVDGLAFGVAVWLLSDNLLAPALRLSDWAWRYPLGSNLKGLLAHLVYGTASAIALGAEMR